MVTDNKLTPSQKLHVMTEEYKKHRAEIAGLQRHAREVEGAHALMATQFRTLQAERDAAWAKADQLDDTLRLRSAALGRVAKQLDEVRKLHVRNGSNRCRRCRETYPCETARAAGIEQ